MSKIVTGDDFVRHVLKSGYEFPLGPRDWSRLAVECGYEQAMHGNDTRSPELKAADEQVATLNEEIRAARGELARAEGAARGRDGRLIVRSDYQAIVRPPADPDADARIAELGERVQELEQAHQAAVLSRERLLRPDRRSGRLRRVLAGALG